MSPADVELPPGVGPHELRERELLLAGEKPVALFFDTPEFIADVWSDFADDVADGRLIAWMQRYEEPRHTWLRLTVARPDAEAQMIELFALMDELHTKRLPWTEDVDRRIGRLLGYREADIEAFIAWQGLSSS